MLLDVKTPWKAMKIVNIFCDKKNDFHSFFFEIFWNIREPWIHTKEDMRFLTAHFASFSNRFQRWPHMARTKADALGEHAEPEIKEKKSKKSKKEPKDDTVVATQLDFEITWPNFEKIKSHFRLTDAETHEVLVATCGPDQSAERYWAKYKVDPPQPAAPAPRVEAPSTPAAGAIPMQVPEPAQPSAPVTAQPTAPPSTVAEEKVALAGAQSPEPSPRIPGEAPAEDVKEPDCKRARMTEPDPSTLDTLPAAETVDDDDPDGEPMSESPNEEPTPPVVTAPAAPTAPAAAATSTVPTDKMIEEDLNKEFDNLHGSTHPAKAKAFDKKTIFFIYQFLCFLL